MLFVIPGIIAVYRYSFAIWNLCQNPELGVMEALNRSKRQTIGYKGQLFGLHLSFIGWYLIVFVIVGVYEGVILALMPDSFLGIMLGSRPTSPSRNAGSTCAPPRRRSRRGRIAAATRRSSKKSFTSCIKPAILYEL